MNCALIAVFVFSAIVCVSHSVIHSSLTTPKDADERIDAAGRDLTVTTPESRSVSHNLERESEDLSTEDDDDSSSEESSESGEENCSLTFKVPAHSFTSCGKTDRIEANLAILKEEFRQRLKVLEERVHNVLSDEADKSSFRHLEDKVYEIQKELGEAMDVESQTTAHPVLKKILNDIEREKEDRLGMEGRLKELEVRNQDVDCRLMGRAGVFSIRPLRGPSKMKVFCDNTWLVIQRRVNGSVNFYRDWHSYRGGFGELGGEFWLGNQHIHHLTTQSKYKLRIELEDWHGRTFYGEYSHFFIESEMENFRLHLSGFTGNIVDSMKRDESTFNHNGMPFTTYDRNNGPNPNVNCALKYEGAWWYNDCYASNLNGRWCDPHDPNKLSCIVWYGLFTKHVLEKVTMKIKENLH